MMSRLGVYTTPRAGKARGWLGVSTPVIELTKAKALIQAMKLKAIVCNPESFGGFHDSNAHCSECGKEVYCLPVCSEVQMKLCVKCARLLFT
jgi:hypothetical protein